MNDEDFIECDHGCDLPPSADGKCVNEATSYCSGCECWRCDAHDCDCGKGLDA